MTNFATKFNNTDRQIGIYMSKDNNYITMLGTGNALATHGWQSNLESRISFSIIQKTERSTLAANDIRWRRERCLLGKSLYLMIWKE